MSDKPTSQEPVAPPSPNVAKPKRIRQPATATPEKSPYPPQFEGCEPPQSLWRNRFIGNKEIEVRGKKVKGILHLAGRGSKTAQVMFISPSVTREESWSNFSSEPHMLKGPAASLFQRCLKRLGFKDEDWFYTALAKYNVERLKPKADDIRWNQAVLEDEIKTIKPKIIVCLGKIPFDHLFKMKFSLKDIQGGFFRSDVYDCLLYPMDTIMTPLMKPEFLERFIIDLKEVKRALDELQGVTVVKVATDYHVIEKSEQLVNLMADLKDRADHQKLTALSADSEWHGQTYASGQWRSFQLGWAEGSAAYIRLMDDQLKYAFDVPLQTVSEICSPVLNDRRIGFVGHNWAADALWFKYHLGVDIYQRCRFDTMFAQQCLNEYADLKLERLSVRYTDLGRYDIELAVWKKVNKFDEEENEGYGLIPDRILIPYGLRDVDATLRCVRPLSQQLVQQNLIAYFFNRRLPFVTDGFIELMETGLPTDLPYLDSMRETFTRNQEWLVKDFRVEVRKEAQVLLFRTLAKIDATQGQELFLEVFSLIKEATSAETGHINQHSEPFKQAFSLLKTFAGQEHWPRVFNLFMHWVECPQFNVNSVDHLRRWLFDVKQFKPLKTTKKEGIQIPWEKVLALPPEKQLEYTPAADKQTIKVFSDKDPLVSRIQELKSVGNIVKAFLKGPDEDGKEQGLHKWVQPDGRIHANFALTETARPRAWKPNILNWPKAVTKPIEAAFKRINETVGNEKRKEMEKLGAPPALIEAEVAKVVKAAVSLRSAICAPQGMAFIDMDLKTAEVVGLAYLSGDENMINVLTQPDTQFACIDKENPKKVVRLGYDPVLSPYPEAEWDPQLITSADDPRILRKPDGSIIHPKRDLHWEMGESVALKPREKCDERMERDGCGKVGNFSIPYGASGPLLERMIEVNTGKKPAAGTGERMIQGYANRYPVADRFLKAMEKIVENPGYYRSIAGGVRHFFFNNLEDLDGMSEYTRGGILSPLTRQARNFPMQNIVAETTAQALVQFVSERRKQDLQARIMMLLYDAMTAIAPLEQLKPAIALLKSCLTERCKWTVHGRTFNFEVDAAIAFRWGVKLTKDEKKIVEPYLA